MITIFHRLRLLVLLSVFIFLPVVSHSASPAVDTFDGGNIGDWDPNTISTTVLGQSIGGNPGGFLESLIVSPPFNGIVGTVNRDEPWIGNFAAAGINFFSVDLKFFQTLINPRLRVRRSSGENGWHYVLIPSGTASNSWQHFEINFDPTWSDQQAMDNGWVQEGGTGSFSQVWSSVTNFEIRADGADEDEVALGIDNVTIGTGPASISSVPTLGEWGLIAMTVVLGVISFIAIRRKRITA